MPDDECLTVDPLRSKSEYDDAPRLLRLRCRYRCLLPLWVRPCLLALLSSAARSTIIIVEVGVVVFVIALVAIIAIVIVWPGQTYRFMCVPWSNEDFERELLLLLRLGIPLKRRSIFRTETQKCPAKIVPVRVRKF